MTKFKGGRAIYGEVLGIMMFDTNFPKIPGDISNASTYDFPVRIKTYKIKGARVEELAREDPALLQEYIRTARELEREGVRAITTSCGFSIIFQDKVANAVGIPVFLSSLLQLPLVYRILRKGEKIGIITHDSRLLTLEFLRRAGVDLTILKSAVIAGMQEEPHWIMSADVPPYVMDSEEVEEAVVRVTKQLISKNPEVGAIVIECHNLPPYSAAVREETGLPIFDIQTLLKMVYKVVFQTRYTGLM